MADSEYVISIAAEFPAGQATTDQLDSLVERLSLGGRKSDTFRDAVAQLTSQLDAAKAASAAANSALSAGNDQYSSLEKAASSAAKALEKAQNAGRFDPRAARAASEAQGALDGYTGTLRKLEGESKVAGAAQAKLENALKNVNAAGAHQDVTLSQEVKRYRALAGAARLLPGPLGKIVGEHFREEGAVLKLGSAFGSTNAAALVYTAGAVATVAVVAALTAALVVGYAALAKYAIGQADAARSLTLSKEAFAATDKASADAASHFDAVQEATGLTDEAMRGLTGQLKDLADPMRKAVISSKDLPSALRAAALAEAALGKGGSADFLKRIEEGRLSVQAFASMAESKFGPIVAKQLLGLTAQSERFSRLWTGLFAGLDIEPVLNGIHRLLDDLEAGQPLAKFFAFVLNAAFGDVAAAGDNLAIKIEAAFLDIAIDVVKAYLAVKPYLGAFKIALEALGIAALAIAVSVGAAVALMVVSVLVPLTLIGAAIYGVVKAVQFLGSVFGVAIPAVGKAFEGFATDATAWGKNMVAGLVSGIQSGQGDVKDATNTLLTGGIDTAQETLDSHSPSRVYADLGRDTASDYTGGVEAGTPAAQGSVARMVSPADAPTAPGGVSRFVSPTDAGVSADSAPSAQASAASVGRNANLDLQGATFNFYGVKDAEHSRDLFSEAFTRLLEGDADSLGGAVPVGAV